VVALLGGNTGLVSSGISIRVSGGFSSVVAGFPSISGSGCGGLSSDMSGLPRCGLSSVVSGLPGGGLSKEAPGLPEVGLSFDVSGSLGGGLSSNLGGLVCSSSEVIVDGLVVGVELAACIEVPVTMLVDNMVEGLLVCC